jgi:hypothetical protein
MGKWLKNNFRLLIYISFLVPIITVAIVSISHVTVWYGISNPMSWALYLSIGIEIAALSALAAISAQMGSKVYVPFGIVTLIQFIGNIFFAFEFIKIGNEQFLSWVELTGPILEYIGIEQGDLQSHRRFLAIFAGGMLPLISLSFLHMLVKFNEENNVNVTKEENGEDTKKVIEEETKIKPTDEELNKLEDLLNKFKPEERVEPPTSDLPDEARGFEPPLNEEDVFDEEPPEWFTEQPPISDDIEEHLQTIIDNDQEMGLWDNTTNDGLEDTEESHSDHLYEEPNLSRIKESAEEWDEDHALDMVMNDMVQDLTEEDLKEIEVNEPEEVKEEPVQPTPNKVSNRYEQRSDYLTKSTDWDSKEKEGLLPDTIETAELDLQTGEISTPTPKKEVSVDIDANQFTPKNDFEVDVEINPSPTPIPTTPPFPNFVVGKIQDELQDQTEPEKKN